MEDKKDSLMEFLNILFDEGEYTWFKDIQKTSAMSVPYENGLEYMGVDSPDGVTVNLHPAINNNVRLITENIKEKKYRNFLIEIDDIPLEAQVNIFKEHKIPYSAIVFSGNKSYHLLISLEEPVDYSVYKEWYDMLSCIIPYMDNQNGVPVRGIRLPFTFRNGNEQKLCAVKSRISNSEFKNWLSSDENFLRWVSSDQMLNKEKKKYKNNNSNVVKDRSGIIETIRWYMSNVDYQQTPSLFIMQCPVCAEEGRDNHRDNMAVKNEDFTFKCWAVEEHNKRILQVIRDIRDNIDKEEKEKIKKGMYSAKVL